MFKQTALLTAVLGLLAAVPAHASLVTLSGNTVNYTFDDSLLGLFGTPTVSGNLLSFTPTTFSAQSLSGELWVLTHGTINIAVSLKPGYTFSTVALRERGDYVLQGRQSKVSVTGQLRVFSKSNPLYEVTSTLTPLTSLSVKSGNSQNWRAAAGMNLTNYPNYFSTAPINVTVENLLWAYSGNFASRAYIEKKFVGLDVMTAPVPEAKDWVMMLAGLGLVGLQMRRRMRIDGSKHIQTGA